MNQTLHAAKDRGVIDSTEAAEVRHRPDGAAVRVFVVDDDRLFQEALAALLRANELEVVGTAGSGESALAAIPAANPDVVLMDLQMPNLGGRSSRPPRAC